MVKQMKQKKGEFTDYSQIEESGAQTRESIKKGVGRLKKTGNFEKDEKRIKRRLAKDKELARQGQEKPPARPNRLPNKDYRGGKRTRKKRRRKKNTRRKKRKRKKTRRKKKKRKKTRRK